MKYDVWESTTRDVCNTLQRTVPQAFRSLVRAVTALTLATSAVLLIIQAAATAEIRERVLKYSKRGSLAVSELQSRDALYSVSHRHKFSTGELRRLFKTDASLILDPTLSLYYEDAALVVGNGTGATEAATVAAASAYPLADTFRLHSRPGAARTIYLDFNGHIISGTAWNSAYNGGSDIVAPAWSLDGDASTFSDQERTAIQDMWIRVSEDYAPFDVDVTTELSDESLLSRSSSTDQVYGTRALISPISSYFCPSGCGGIAYVGVFNYIGADTYKPALIFPERLSNGSKYIAEAISHEVGHNLGLSHDGTTTGSSYYQGHGTGETGWAPIMGVGYYKNLTQWSKGEYPYANNTQDDLAVMQRYGLTARADDHGDSPAGATGLSAGATFSARGILGSRTDVDVFRFSSSGGTLLLDVTVANLGADADLAVKILDANQAVVASINPVESLSASLSIDLGVGDYFIVVDGTGKGDLMTGYSDYASSGQFEVTGAFSAVSTPTPQPSVTVSPLATATATATATPTTTQTPMDTVNPTATPTSTPTFTYTQTATPTITATPTATATSTPKPKRKIRVASVQLDVRATVRGVTMVEGQVMVTDSDGNAVSGAIVSVALNGFLPSGVRRQGTNSRGVASFMGMVVSKSNASMTVSNVTKQGETYDPSINLASSASIATAKKALRSRPLKNAKSR